jgi:serine protease Do
VGWVVLCAVVVGASPVIDDAALEAKFTQGLLAPGVDGLSGARASQALAEAEGKTVAIGAEARPGVFDYEAACRSVVVVGSVEYCRDCKDWHMGAVSSGWVIGPRGHVVTNFHVLQDKKAGELGVMTYDGTVYPVSKVLAADREGDAAILLLEAGGAELPALPLAGAAKTGEAIHVVGHPDGRFYTLTEGIVSRVFTEATAGGDGRRTWLTVTADYGGGSSGAPVLNKAGEVTGMVSSTAALLADTEEGKEPAAADVQMVFRDCVSVETMRKLVE